MAGGTFTSFNKVLPGVYINVESKENLSISVGDRGIVAIAKALHWGPTEIMEITPGEDLSPYIGYDITNPNALFLREMMKGSDMTTGPSKILLCRLGNDGAPAEASIGALTAVAKCQGTRGNDIMITITADPDVTGSYTVSTIVDGSIVDSQIITALEQLVANDWVNFVGDGTTITTTAGEQLTGGTDPTVTANSYANFLVDIEAYDFDILAYDGTDATVAEAVKQFVIRMNESVGKKCQAVMGMVGVGMNTKYVISTHNGVMLNDGTDLHSYEAVWWLAGAEAGANYNQSLTYAQYPGAKQASPKLTDRATQAAIEAGQLCFIDTFGVVKVCTDINSKTSVTPKEGKEFKKNRIMRVINQFCNDCYENFSNNFIGKVDNNEAGRSLLRAWIIGYLNEMQANNGIQNFAAEDVSVLPGADIDAVLINVLIQPVDSIEKIYMTVTVTANGSTVVTA